MLLKTLSLQKGSRLEYSSLELLFLGQSGQPYRASLFIKFTSKGEGFDLRDFKRYLTSLRAKTFYSEDIAHEIFSTISNSISADDLGVIIDITARGGIQQRVSFGEEFTPTKKANIFQIH
jgi:NADPH-dependent 7-cyano-7-deazaguanine reductase QueF